jgi:hypothetical protein
MKVALELEGLNGRQYIEPADPTATEVTTPKIVVGDQGDDPVYSAGAFTRVKEPSLGMIWLWVDGDPQLGTLFGSCVYSETSQASATAFVPPCPQSEGRQHVSVENDVLYSSTAFGASGLGAWFTTASTVEESGSVALWISFD